MARDSVRKYFTENTESWFERYSSSDFDSVMYQDRAAAALRLLWQHGRAGSLILDAGCGAGVQSLALKASGYRVLSFDLSSEMAKRAKRTLDDVGTDGCVAVADLENLPLRPGSLDAVVTLGVLGYADHPERVLARLRDALKQDGLLVASCLNRDPLLGRISDWVSVLPNALYLWGKRILTGRAPASAPPDDGFYERNLRYVSARDFDQSILHGGFEKRSGLGVEFGRPHFMGKRVLPERLEILLSRLISRVARVPLLGFLDDYARQYVGCFVKGPERAPR